MKRQVQRQNEKNRNINSQNDKLNDRQLLLLADFIRRSPKSIQKQLVPIIILLQKQSPHEQLKKLIEELGTQGEYKMQVDKIGKLIRTIIKLLQLKSLTTCVQKVLLDATSIENSRSNICTSTKSDGFEKIDLIYPQYDIYYKMSKQQRGHHLPQHHCKKSQKDFFSDPRFLLRIQQLAHYKSNEKLKDNILLLTYQGSRIIGSKSYAIVRERYIEIWSMKSGNYPIPLLGTPKELNDDGKKKQQEKKEVQKQITEVSKFDIAALLNGHTEKITSISFSLDQYYLISGSVDRTVKLWCVRTKSQICTYKSHLKVVWDVDFSESGYFFLSGSADGWMILWKTDQPHPQRIYNHKGDVYKVKFSKDSNFVISGGEDGCIKIWKTINAELQRQLRVNRAVINFNLGFSGALLVSIQSDGKITIFDLSKGTIINSFYFHEDKKDKLTGKTVLTKNKVHDVCLSEDERQLSCVSSNHIAVYSMERLQMKVTKNIYSFNQQGNKEKDLIKIVAKEVIYVGKQTNLTYCKYQHKNVLVVAGRS